METVSDEYRLELDLLAGRLVTQARFGTPETPPPHPLRALGERVMSVVEPQLGLLPSFRQEPPNIAA